MQIADIKQKLTILEVLAHYNLKPNKNNLLCCPFHKDKTPSLQLYPETNTYNCFGCGKTGDVIQFIQDFEKTDKHSAIMKAQTLINPFNTPSNNTVMKQKENTDSSEPADLSRIAILTKAFNSFVRGAKYDNPQSKEYLESRKLDITKLEIGYNSGQFHHRKSKQLVESLVKYHLLQKIGIRNDDAVYSVWAKHCIIFALRDKQDHVTSLYGRSILDKEESKHFYLKDRSGLYPHYPKPETERLILTEAIIDASTLLQIEAITSDYSLLACYGTNGLSEEHTAAIQELKQLKEIIFAFDADEAGRVATMKYANELHLLFPEVKISKLELPEGEDVNSLSTGHDNGVFTDLLNKRVFLFSTEKNTNQLQEKNKTSETSGKPENAEAIKKTILLEEKNTIKKIAVKTGDAGTQEEKINAKTLVRQVAMNHNFNTANPYKLRYTTETANYYVQGGVSRILDSMKITLVIESQQTQQKARNKTDLYEDKQIEKLCKDVSEKLNLRKDLLETDIYKLTDLLDEYREVTNATASETTHQPKKYTMTEKEKTEALALAKTPGLVNHICGLLGQAGIVGEEKNRIFLFVSGTSHNSNETLHVLIQGSSGSGKTRLFRLTIDCMPAEAVIRLTRVSDKSFYNYPENFLSFKVIGLEDVDGLTEEAEYAYRELVSNGELISSISIKDESGKIASGHKTVKGPIASMACTTNGSVYEDNVSRMFVIAVDESKEQTRRIIAYQNAKSAGKTDGRKENGIKQQLQNLVRILKNKAVLNPYAESIHLPEEADQLRRLNDLFKIFIHHITRINQYQRKTDAQGRLISTLEDVETAIDIMFDSIVLKVDELDGSLRQFYEKLKDYIKKTGKSTHDKYEFTQREIRHALNVSKTQIFRFLNDLAELEYIQQTGGYQNKGYKYRVIYWDDYKALRERIKKHLNEQLEQLKKKNN
jgi:DNA primase